MSKSNVQKQQPQVFIPAWLDDYGLSQPEFRIYCHLCRRADNETGIAWPDAQSISETCRVHRNTVWKALKSIEEKGLVKRVGKPFGKSNRYRICTPPISTNGAPIEDDQSAQMDSQLEASQLAQIERHQSATNLCHQSAQMERHKGNPIKVPQLRLSNIPLTPKRGNHPKPRRKNLTESQKKRIRVTENTEQMVKVGAALGRKPETLWTIQEAEALQDVNPSDDEIKTILEYYQIQIPSEKDYRRRQITTLLNNWMGELDKAKLHKLDQR